MSIELGYPNQNDRDALRNLWKEAFGDGDDVLDLFEATAYSPQRALCLRLDGRVAAALYWFDCECEGEKIAYLYAIATKKEWRGRGICRQLMEFAHGKLGERGYAAAMLVPSEESLFGFYEKLGYENATEIAEISCDAANEMAELVRIDAEKYAMLRRKMLPVGGVVQENENLSYLAAQTELWRGKEILLAARREEEKLIGVELLGDVDKAPSILRTLKCEKGVFRTPGKEKKISMIHQLNTKTAIFPTYFGFPFD